MDKSRYMIRFESPDIFRVLKFNDTGDMEGQYRIVKGRKDALYCDCPHASHPQRRGSGPCRHLRMVALFKQKRAINQPIFYCYDTEEWGTVKDLEP